MTETKPLYKTKMGKQGTPHPRPTERKAMPLRSWTTLMQVVEWLRQNTTQEPPEPKEDAA